MSAALPGTDLLEDSECRDFGFIAFGFRAAGLCFSTIIHQRAFYSLPPNLPPFFFAANNTMPREGC